MVRIMLGTKPSLPWTTSRRFLALLVADAGSIALKRDMTNSYTFGFPTIGSGFHFQDHFQFDRGAERQARNTKDKARRNGLFAEDISKQLRRGIGDLGVLRELRRCGDVHAQPHDAAHAVQ